MIYYDCIHQKQRYKYNDGSKSMKTESRGRFMGGINCFYRIYKLLFKNKYLFYAMF